VYVLRQNCRAAGWRWDIKINSIEKCKYLQEETLLCSDLIPLPHENPTCKIEARDGRRRVDFICRHRHVDNTSSMQWRLVRGGRYGSADPEIYLKRTQFKTVHLYLLFKQVSSFISL
jgi:hypothetical protein